jgi:phosphate/sulfate permease
VGQRGAFAEKIFGWLQVLTACYMTFSHGANDVANAASPALGIASYCFSHNVTGEQQVIILVCAHALGGLGGLLEIATWTYKVIETWERKSLV